MRVETIKPLRVLLVDTYLPDDRHSMKLFVRCLQAELPSQNIEVILASPNQKKCGMVIRVFNKFIVFPLRIWYLGRDCDVQHICDTSHAVFLNFLRGTWVTTVHDLGGLNEGKHKDTLFRRLWNGALRHGLNRSTLLVPVSQHSLTELENLIPGISGRSRKILNSTYQKFPKCTVSRSLWDMHFPNISFESKYVLHIGSNEPRKNRATVVRTLKEIRKHADVELIFAGHAPDTSLLDEIKALDLAAHVHVAKWPNEEGLCLLYQRAQALLFPSTYEGFGIPVIEAQLNHCPVICSNIAPHLEILRGTGLSASPHDAVGFAKLFLGIEDRTALTTKGLENARFFSPARMAFEYAEAYRSIKQ